MFQNMPFAFKEWAVVCRALASGRQDVILRKGGIVEDGGTFRVDHDSFYLLPTFLHQSKDCIIPEAQDLFIGIESDRPPSGSVVFTHEATIVRSSRVTSLDVVSQLRGRHIWSDAVVSERFHRWKNELHVLEVSVRALPQPLTSPWSHDYDGCKSWVEVQAEGGSL